MESIAIILTFLGMSHKEPNTTVSEVFIRNTYSSYATLGTQPFSLGKELQVEIKKTQR